MDYVKRITNVSNLTLSRITHVSNNDVTLCGKQVDDKWYVVGDTSDVNCKKCREALV